jgi:phospholipase C
MRNLVRALAIGGAVLTAAVGAPPAFAADTAPAAGPVVTTTTPIKHFVYLMQSDRSFDNYFGSYPGVDGTPAGTCLPLVVDKPQAGCIAPFALNGRTVPSLDSNKALLDAQFNNGKMDGFVAAYGNQARDGSTAMGYYDRRDLPYYWQLADDYVLFDKFSSSARDSTRTNRSYWVSGAGLPGGVAKVPPTGYGDAQVTVFDRLQAAGVSWKFYIEDYDAKQTFRAGSETGSTGQTVRAPLLNYARFVDNPALAGHIADLDEYYSDVRSGTLPAVAYVASSSSSERSAKSVQSGQKLVRGMVNQLMTSRYWQDSAFLWSYDDSGGWYDHVTPPTVGADTLGFRVPALLVSGYANRGQVNHTQLDSTSALKFIEDNWGVAPLTTRDANANNLTSAFSFNEAPRQPEILPLNGPAASSGPPIQVASIYRYYGAAAGFVLLMCLIAGVRSAVATRRRRRGPDSAPEPETETETETQAETTTTAIETEATVR